VLAGPRRRWLIPAGVAVALITLVGLGTAAGWWGGPGCGDGSGTGAQAGSGDQIRSCVPPTGQGWNPITLGDDPTGEEKLPNSSLVFRVKDAHWRARDGKWQVVLATSMTNATSSIAPGSLGHRVGRGEDACHGGEQREPARADQ
jgi:hypothetical protein